MRMMNKTSQGSWFPTHSAEKAEWMGHGACVGVVVNRLREE
jgi:hypothetical protein